MNRGIFHKRGFTLLEIIVSLFLVGIVTAVIGLSSYHMVNSFVFAQKNADTLLKGQVAIARMVKELNNVK
ncbi:MAG: type II secretion system protein [Syntrophales bacterium]|jgi:prepilin-type N-terminal cleavage/methylation domain-containing protein|nr:type II secretion system protein [Syntrophales bacterium]